MEKESQEKPVEKKRHIRIGTISIILAAAIGVLVVVYGLLFQPSPSKFFGNVVTYLILGIIVFWILLLLYHFGAKSGMWIRGYIIAVLLLILTYSLMAVIVPPFAVMGIDHFHFGVSTGVLITVLSTIHKIDGRLDRRDVLFGIFVVMVMIGANIPFFHGGASFLDKIGSVFEFVVERIVPRIPV